MTIQPRPSASVQAFLDAPDRPRRSYRDMPLSQLRRLYEAEQLWGAGAPEPLASVDDLDADGVRARRYTPDQVSDGVLVWLHGGGWNLGSVDSHDALCAAIANRARIRVLSVHYRLAPEHPHPAALDDAWKVVRWASEHFRSVAVGGDSAGGTLATAAALRARDVGLELAMQLLVYPVLEYRVDHPSYRRFRTRYQHFGGVPAYGAEYQDTIADIWRQYVPDPARRTLPDVSPLRAADLSGLAPVHLVIAEHDILREEDDEYVERLRSAGVPVEVSFHPGQIHGFFPLLRVFPEARSAVARCSEALDGALGRTGRSGA